MPYTAPCVTQPNSTQVGSQPPPGVVDSDSLVVSLMIGALINLITQTTVSSVIDLEQEEGANEGAGDWFFDKMEVNTNLESVNDVNEQLATELEDLDMVNLTLSVDSYQRP